MFGKSKFESLDELLGDFGALDPDGGFDGLDGDFCGPTDGLDGRAGVDGSPGPRDGPEPLKGPRTGDFCGPTDGARGTPGILGANGDGILEGLPFSPGTAPPGTSRPGIGACGRI